MPTIGAFEAKTQLPKLLRAVENGETFTITNRGRPVAVLAPVPQTAESNFKAAAEAMLAFARSRPSVTVNIKALIEEGRA